VCFHLRADRLARAGAAPRREPGQHLLEHVPAEGIARSEVLVGAKRQLVSAVGASDSRPPDCDAPSAERHLARLVPVANGGTLGVVLTPGADDLVDLFREQLGEDAQPDPDAEREQSLLRRADELSQSCLHAGRQGELARADLLPRYGLHGGSSCR
jgi:hypothetical protein